HYPDDPWLVRARWDTGYPVRAGGLVSPVRLVERGLASTGCGPRQTRAARVSVSPSGQRRLDLGDRLVVRGRTGGGRQATYSAACRPSCCGTGQRGRGRDRDAGPEQ